MIYPELLCTKSEAEKILLAVLYHFGYLFEKNETTGFYECKNDKAYIVLGLNGLASFAYELTWKTIENQSLSPSQH